MAQSKHYPLPEASSTQEKVSIFATMSALAKKHNAINLGQGFPDFDAPDFVKEALHTAIEKGYNQYALLAGEASLRHSLSGYYEDWYGLSYHSDDEITVTHGATQALWTIIQAAVRPGDAVLVFEPCYDSYTPAIHHAGGYAVAVRLHAPSFAFSEEELKKAFEEHTIKAVIVNSPHNPTGRVFSLDELECIAELARRSNALVISDEVYEHITFGENKHIPIATLPDMKERTCTISSAGKTFSATGWKIGWLAAPAAWQRAFRSLHQYMLFSVHTPSQHALAKVLPQAKDYMIQLRQEYLHKEQLLRKYLLEAGFDVQPAEGSYFLMADYSRLSSLAPADFAMQLIKEKGVVCIPPESFYVKQHEYAPFVRFSFCKKEHTIDEAGKALLR